MYFGYRTYLEKKGRSEQTIRGYMTTLDMFFAFLDKLYGKQKEVYEINPSDIKDFLKDRLQEGNEIKTINKHLSILKNFFDYLWRKEKISYDPTVKIKRYKVTDNKANILTYERLLDTLPRILNNNEYTSMRKSIYILALKGLKSSDFHFLKRDVIDRGSSVEIILKKKDVYLHGEDAEIFLNYFFEAQFNGSEYVFTSKRHNGSIVPIENMSIHTHLKVISEEYDFPTKMTLNDTRESYAFYLYTRKRINVEDIAEILGIEVDSAANLVKLSIERHNKGKVLLDKNDDTVVS